MVRPHFFTCNSGAVCWNPTIGLKTLNLHHIDLDGKFKKELRFPYKLGGRWEGLDSFLMGFCFLPYFFVITYDFPTPIC